jgi:hypothetical protein
VRLANRALIMFSAAAIALPALLAAPQSGAATQPVGYAGPARGVVQVGPDVSSSATQHAQSRNWDGYVTYVSRQADFNFVKATWVQPVVHCQAAQAWTVFWIGLDGWFDGTVEQGGSSAYCPTKNGAPQYTLWWEMFPTNSIQSVMATKAGDTITSTVTYKPATKKFVIFVKDVTTGKSFTKTEACGSGQTCNRSSTDVITEDVGRFGSGNYFPLANYGTMHYTQAGATDIAGHSGSLSSTHWTNAAITEAGGGITYATVSALASGGTSFATTWKHS